jgi:hypothetical protein
MTFQSLEKIGYPLMIFAAIVAIWAWFRTSTTKALTYLGGQGFDPGRWTGDTTQTPAYLAGVPESVVLDPAYIGALISHPYANDGQTALPTGAPASGYAPGYVIYNTAGRTNPALVTGYSDRPGASPGGCGGGCSGSCGGCEPKCKTACNSNVRFTDGRGMCQSNPAYIPPAWPTMFYGIEAPKSA